jgi:transposase
VRADAQGLTPAVRRQSAEQAEIARLRRELRRVEEERDILKKAAAFFASPRRSGSSS